MIITSSNVSKVLTEMFWCLSQTELNQSTVKKDSDLYKYKWIPKTETRCFHMLLQHSWKDFLCPVFKVSHYLLNICHPKIHPFLLPPSLLSLLSHTSQIYLSPSSPFIPHFLLFFILWWSLRQALYSSISYPPAVFLFLCQKHSHI